MPIYDYRCDHCGHAFSAIQSFKDEALGVCPNCGLKPRRLLVPPALVFKGSGWYVTDSRKGGDKSESGEGGDRGGEKAASGDKSGTAKSDKGAKGGDSGGGEGSASAGGKAPAKAGGAKGEGGASKSEPAS